MRLAPAGARPRHRGKHGSQAITEGRVTHRFSDHARGPALPISPGFSTLRARAKQEQRQVSRRRIIAQGADWYRIARPAGRNVSDEQTLSEAATGRAAQARERLRPVVGPMRTAPHAGQLRG